MKFMKIIQPNNFQHQDVLPLRDVLLTIEPKVVQRSSHSTLRCSYDLRNNTLYSVKWYRGRYEFYRYTPSDSPKTKVFPVRGINVDVHNSNSTQVVLRDIDFIVSGNFSCEVTSDGPQFLTGIDTKVMSVVQLPEDLPTIRVEGEPLDYGDILRANCSCPPSRPRATLTFLLNNYTVARSEPLSPRQHQELAWSDLSLELELSEFHFNSGRLILQCIAEMEDIYREEAVLKLGSVRDPVPERVSAFSDATSISSEAALRLVVIINILLMLT
ncbi:uncharacterized protein isoform X2 [Leptinotarsa decemlineata]|uniref:uncharacterized protein isoform X2 n=1 Tax=Leptinotarsa decemlineata TaxID=7539 RepID=UPI003D30A3F0